MKRLVAGMLIALFLFPILAHADDQEAQQIIDKAVKALGGADKAKQRNSVTIKSKSKLGQEASGLEFTMTGKFHDYDQVLLEITLHTGNTEMPLTLAMNKDKAWSRSGENAVEEGTGGMMETLVTVMYSVRSAGHPSQLANRNDATVTSGGIGKVGDVEANILRIVRKDKPEIRHFFDAKTGLPLKSESSMTEGGQEQPIEFQYSRFVEVDGQKYFSKIKAFRDGKLLIESDLIEVKFGQKFDQSIFVKP